MDSANGYKRRIPALTWRVIFALAIFLHTYRCRAQSIDQRLYVVEVSAAVNTSPTRILLSWPPDPNATTYAVSRKLINSTSWTSLGTMPGTATQFSDNQVSVGSAFEYQIQKTTSLGYSGSGYIYAGIYAPAIESRGKLILLVDSTWSAALAPELKRLAEDLIGDGWTVLRQDVSRAASVASVKATLQSLYASDPQNVKALFIFGHVPVPYSGDTAPDNHDNHKGAWATDTYYADMDGTWTDSSVNDVLAEKPWNHNVPGDGKFDQSKIPSDLELQVGRVDLANMTAFSNKTPSRDEEALLRQYLDKDHKYRHGQLPVSRRGLVCDNFADSEALASTGWRNFAPLFGPGNNRAVGWGEYFPTLNAEGYLFSYADGGGSFYTCAGIGSSDDFALNDIKTVFTFFFGSYFGDWDNESNFLRASLGCSTYTLTAAWGGRPHWFLHHMGLGETIGFGTRLTQNNVANGLYTPSNQGARGIQTSLLGDPTLRLHPVIPPSSAKAVLANGVKLSWNPSPDSAIQGYYIYAGAGEAGPFGRISGRSIVSGNSFNDPNGTVSSVYMVRAVKLESTPSGSYFNLSQGIVVRPGTPPTAPSGLTAVGTTSQITLTWQDHSDNEEGFYVYRKGSESSFTRISTLSPGTTSFADTTGAAGVTYSYAVSSYNTAGESALSNTAAAALAGSVSGVIVGLDEKTGGSWKGVYGRDGYYVILNAQNYPAYVSVSAAGNSGWIWNDNVSDPAALQRATDNSRIAACWYAFSPFDLQLRFNDSNKHRVAFYLLDWDFQGRKETIEFSNADTGALLGSQTIQSFQNGVYLVCELQGRIAIRFRPVVGNAVLSGIFFDTPGVPTVATPIVNPAGGIFTDSVDVAITSATSDASIHYTTDGSVPSTSSQLYTGNFLLNRSATVRAKAFKTGMLDSAEANAVFKITSSQGSNGTAVFNGVDMTRGGDWKGAYGLQGAVVIADSQALPGYVTLGSEGKSDWVWEYSTPDTRALQRVNVSPRLAACWYASGAFDIELNFADDQLHAVSFYCLDWDRAGRQQRIEILDYNTGQVLNSYSLGAFDGGVYVNYTLSGHLIARFNQLGALNAVLSGIFFDAPH